MCCCRWCLELNEFLCFDEDLCTSACHRWWDCFQRTAAAMLKWFWAASALWQGQMWKINSVAVLLWRYSRRRSWVLWWCRRALPAADNWTSLGCQSFFMSWDSLRKYLGSIVPRRDVQCFLNTGTKTDSQMLRKHVDFWCYFCQGCCVAGGRMSQKMGHKNSKAALLLCTYKTKHCSGREQII